MVTGFLGGALPGLGLGELPSEETHIMALSQGEWLSGNEEDALQLSRENEENNGILSRSSISCAMWI